MLLAWHNQTMWLNLNLPLLFFTKYNTTLGILLSGLGILAILFNKKSYLQFLGSAIFTLGALTLLQYGFNINLGLDQLFMEDVWGRDTPYPGRMSPNSATCFVCISLVLLLQHRHQQHNSFKVALEILIFTVVATTLAALAGYFAGVGVFYDWGSYTRMAPQTAVAMLSTSIGLASLLWLNDREQVFRLPIWIPALLCFFILWFDLSMPIGIAAGIAYVPLIFCSLWYKSPLMPFWFALISTLLVTIGFLYSQHETVLAWIVITNRMLAIGTIWFVALLVYFSRQDSNARRQSENQLRSVVNTVIDGLITIDEKGIVHSFNPAAENIFGYTPEEVLGRNIKILMPEPYQSEHDQYLSNYLNTGDAKIIGIGREVHGRHKNGNVFPIDLGVNEMYIGTTRMFVGTIRNISERKEAERKNALLAAIVESSENAIISKDLNGIISTWNLNAEKLLGYTTDEAIGQHINLIIPPECLEEEDDEEAKTINTDIKAGNPVKHVETLCMNKNGKRIDIALTASPIFDKDGIIIGVSEIIRDITERKKIEADMQRYILALTRSNQELDDFAYIASHDLKEPLRGLSNNALFLKEDFQEMMGDSGKKRLNRMMYLCERMEQLVNDLLYFSRLGRQALAIQEIDMNDIIRDIEFMLESTLIEANAKIIVPEKLPTITCDLPRITEVFRNLITNAIKYNNKPEKRVEVGFQITNGEYEFFVRDNGIGIAPEFHSDVFRIFKRLNEEDDSVKGTGVGLTFVKKIIERHNGKISIKSELGQGSTFYFTINEPKET